MPKRLLILLFCLCHLNDSYSQDMKFAQQQANDLSYRIVVRYKNDKKLDSIEVGMGIILRGEYFLTCYHLIMPKPNNFKVVAIKLFYNERMEKGQYRCDSMDLIKNFTLKDGQYDFSKHVYNSMQTDVVVLKLAHSLTAIPFKIGNTPNYLDTVISVGNTFSANNIERIKQFSLFIARAKFPTGTNPDCLLFLSNYTKGFSGTPIIDKFGDVIGMEEGSYEDYPASFDVLLANYPDVRQRIKSEYAKGAKLSIGIDFNLILKTYLKGYL